MVLWIALLALRPVEILSIFDLVVGLRDVRVSVLALREQVAW